MRGTHRVSIGNRRVKYRFDVRRNITIVQGDSGTGKTTLYDLVLAHMREGDDSRVQLSCDSQGTAFAYAKGRLAPAWTIEENADTVMALIRNRNVR